MKSNCRYGNIRSSADILAAFENTFSSDEIMIHYIYSHKDSFLLLLKASGGTEYENFPSMLAEKEYKNQYPSLMSADCLSEDRKIYGTALSAKSVPL